MSVQRTIFKILIKHRETLTWRCVGIHRCLHHQWTSFRGHRDRHFPFFMFRKGCLDCFRVDIWKEREISSRHSDRSCLLVCASPCRFVCTQAGLTTPVSDERLGTQGISDDVWAEKAATVKSAAPTNRPFELYKIPRTALQYLKSRNPASPEQTFV